MKRGGSPRFIPIAIFIIVVIIIIAAIVSIVQGMTRSGTVDNATDPGVASLINMDADRTVRMTARGPIVADENFRSYEIEVSVGNRSLTTYEGYLGSTIDAIKLTNNSVAYEQFVYALARLNFMKSDELKDDDNDIRGRCATGILYEFDVMNADGVVKHLWTTTCSKERGSLGINLAAVRSLFIAQIPDATTSINGINLR